MATAGLSSELPTSTTEAIFGKETRGENDQPKNKEEEIAPKEFFWDQFLKYLATGIALLTLLDLTIQFFQGGNLFCYPPSGYQNETLDATARDQAAYINVFCLQSLTRAEFYAVFILIEGIFLIAPQYLWASLFGGQFDFFFAIVRQIDRLRDSDTGEYRQKNFDLVKRLEKEFPEAPKWNGIVFMYRLKLFSQCVVTFLSIIINGAVFPPQTFDFVFECPSTGFDDNMRLSTNSTDEVPEGWGFPFSVQCVYSSFRVLSKIWYANLILLFAALFMAFYGFLWTFKRHTNALGHKVIAKFAFALCLSPDEYVFKRFHRRPIKPRIVTDLDFLLLRLFRADSGHGQVFKDILTDKELKRLINEDHERLHLYLNAIQDQHNISRLRERQQNMNQHGEGEGENQQTPMRESEDLSERQGNGSETEHRDEPQDSGALASRSKGGQENTPEDQRPEAQHAIDIPAAPAKTSEGKKQHERATDIQSVYFQSGFNVKLNPEKVVYEEELGPNMLGNVKWEDVMGIRDLFIRFCAQFATENHRAYDISFGTIGYSLVLARAFKSVISVNFHPFYRNTEKRVRKEKFHSSITKITFHEDILSQQADSINECDEKVDEEFDLDEVADLPVLKQQINLIVVGPFMGEARKATVTLHIERLYNAKYFSKDALLLAVRPLKIGHRVVADRYCKYEPAKGLFKSQKTKVDEAVKTAKDQRHIMCDDVPTRVTDVKTRETRTEMIRGIKVVSVDHSTQPDIECVFEFAAYKFENIYFPPTSRHRTEEQTQTGMDHFRPREARPSTQQRPPGLLLPSGIPTLGTSLTPAENGPVPASVPVPRPLPPDNESPSGNIATVTIQLSAIGSEAPIQFVLKQNTNKEQQRTSHTEYSNASASASYNGGPPVRSISADSLQYAERNQNGVHLSNPPIANGTDDVI